MYSLLCVELVKILSRLQFKAVVRRDILERLRVKVALCVAPATTICEYIELLVNIVHLARGKLRPPNLNVECARQ